MANADSANRVYVLLMVLSLVLLSIFGCATGRKDAPLEPADGFEVRIYDVFGMDCPGCHGGLEKLVNALPDVEKSEANWKEKRLVVTLKPDAELRDEEVIDAIRRANLTPGERLR